MLADESKARPVSPPVDDHESDIKKLESGVGYMEDRLSKKDEMENKEEPAKKRLPTGVHIISRNEDGSLREDDPLYGKL